METHEIKELLTQARGFLGGFLINFSCKFAGENSGPDFIIYNTIVFFLLDRNGPINPQTIRPKRCRRSSNLEFHYIFLPPSPAYLNCKLEKQF
jgi:hypothetical protein